MEELVEMEEVVGDLNAKKKEVEMQKINKGKELKRLVKTSWMCWKR